MSRTRLITAVLLVAMGALAAALPVFGQNPTITVEPLDCLPVAEHGLVRARVADAPPEAEVRIYFRRLHEIVEDFYWVEMEAESPGLYWTVLPKPAAERNERFDLEERLREGEEQDEHPWGAWWKDKEASDDRDPNEELPEEEIEERASVGKQRDRGWMDRMSLEDLEEWLERQRFEPAEYYGALVAPGGRVLAVSPMLVTEVIDEDDCPVTMTPRQQGFAYNLTIGETAPWQQEREPVFHWLCDHIVTRINYLEVPRADDVCRACVIAWWQKKEFLIPASTAAAALIGVTTFEDDDGPIDDGDDDESPVQP